MTKTMVEEAEQNLVNIAKHFEDTMCMLNALASFGNNYCNEYIGKAEFFKGLSKMRSGLYKELVHAQSNCFIFAGVGGKESLAYSKKLFEEQFDKDERYVVMNYLNEFGRSPNSWLSDEEAEFRKQAKDVLDSL